jgi:hypothetical protein
VSVSNNSKGIVITNDISILKVVIAKLTLT